MLFLVSVNDLEWLGDMLHFADDTSIFACGKTPEGKVQHLMLYKPSQLPRDGLWRMACASKKLRPRRWYVVPSTSEKTEANAVKSKSVYFAMFHSLFSCGIELWGHTAGRKDVLLLQKEAVCVISSAGYLDHCR